MSKNAFDQFVVRTLLKDVKSGASIKEIVKGFIELSQNESGELKSSLRREKTTDKSLSFLRLTNTIVSSKEDLVRDFKNNSSREIKISSISLGLSVVKEDGKYQIKAGLGHIKHNYLPIDGREVSSMIRYLVSTIGETFILDPKVVSSNLSTKDSFSYFIASPIINKAYYGLNLPEGTYLVSNSMGTLRIIKSGLLDNLYKLINKKVNIDTDIYREASDIINEFNSKEKSKANIKEIREKFKNLSEKIEKIKDVRERFTTSVEIYTKLLEKPIGSIEHLGHTAGNEAAQMRVPSWLFEAYEATVPVKFGDYNNDYYKRVFIRSAFSGGNTDLSRARKFILEKVAEASKIKVEVLKNFSTDKLLNILSLEASKINTGKTDDRKIFTDSMTELATSLSNHFNSPQGAKELAALESSPSFMGFIKDAIIKAFFGKDTKKETVKRKKEVSAISKADANKIADKVIAETKKKAAKSQSATTNKKISPAKKVQTDNKYNSEIKRKPTITTYIDGGLSDDDLLSLKNLVNKGIHKKLREEVMLPEGSDTQPDNLVYAGGWNKSYKGRKGRFARSVKVTDIKSNKSDGLDIHAEYMNSPYDTFRKQGGRDPRVIITKGLRSLAVDLLNSKFNFHSSSLSSIRARFNS